jgi:hypothetical protein
VFLVRAKFFLWICLLSADHTTPQISVGATHHCTTIMPLPPEWRSFFVGRKVEHPDIPGVTGVVKYADCTRLGIPKDSASSNLAIDISWVVEWANGIVQVLDQARVANIATDEFVDEPWVLGRVLALQRVRFRHHALHALLTPHF